MKIFLKFTRGNVLKIDFITGFFFNEGDQWSEIRRFTLRYLGQVFNDRLEKIMQGEMSQFFSTIRSGEIMEVSFNALASWLQFEFQTRGGDWSLRLLLNNPSFPWWSTVNQCPAHCGCAFRSYHTPRAFVTASKQYYLYYFTGCMCYFVVHLMKFVTEIIPIWTKQYGWYIFPAGCRQWRFVRLVVHCGRTWFALCAILWLTPYIIFV